jgi:hypothetical protein
MAVPIRGTDVGTWDVPVNGNFNILDSMFGGVSTVALTSAAVTLTSSQAQSSIIRFTGTLTANVAVTLPGIYKFWTVDNQIVNSPSSFAVTLVSTSGASIIGCPPGTQDVFYDGTTVNYRNLGRVGEYWDYAAATVPTWVTASTKPPYLNCNAATFSSAAYPVLANLLGTTTLPDARGRLRLALDAGTNRVTSGVSGVAGNTILAAGGDQSLQSHTHANSLNDPGHTHTTNAMIDNNGSNHVPGSTVSPVSGPASVFSAVTNISITNAAAGAGGSQNIPPVYVGGITMIRAA